MKTNEHDISPIDMWTMVIVMVVLAATCITVCGCMTKIANDAELGIRWGTEVAVYSRGPAEEVAATTCFDISPTTKQLLMEMREEREEVVEVVEEMMVDVPEP